MYFLHILIAKLQLIIYFS